jgi:hypothetical protein
MIMMSALLALGLGIAGSVPASAAPIGGLGSAASSATLLQDIQYYRHRVRCRSVRVCHRDYYRRLRCHYERVCGRW